MSETKKPSPSTRARTKKRTRPRRERNREATQARILQSAEREFATRGFEGARLRDVAAGADVHHALLHHYFGDKLGLFRAVLRNAFDGVSTRTIALLSGGSSMRDMLETYIDMLVDLHAENPNLVRLLHYASLDPESPAFAAAEEITRELSDARRILSLSIGAVAYVFHEDRFFSLFHGDEVRSAASIEEHRKAALAFLSAAVFP